MELYLDPSLTNVLRNHEIRLLRLQALPTGCEYPDRPIVVIDNPEPPPGEDPDPPIPPDHPVCGVCFMVDDDLEICLDPCDEPPPDCPPEHPDYPDCPPTSCPDCPPGGGGEPGECGACLGEMGGTWENSGTPLTYTSAGVALV